MAIESNESSKIINTCKRLERETFRKRERERVAKEAGKNPAEIISGLKENA